jgi:hypothetical protein
MAYGHEEVSLLSTPGRINGKLLRVSLDSGATTSILSAKIAKAYKIKILPSKIKIKTADSMVVPVVGITEALKVEIHGHVCEIDFVVMNHDDHDVLLGLNWFNKTAAGLYPRTKTLHFPGQTIKLDNIGKIEDDEEMEEVFITEVADEDDIGEDVWEFNQGDSRIVISDDSIDAKKKVE